jgi:hypothetical protein
VYLARRVGKSEEFEAALKAGLGGQGHVRIGGPFTRIVNTYGNFIKGKFTLKLDASR